MGFREPALIAVYAITAGSAAILGEEDHGGMEITLSAPVSRVQLFGQRFTALLIGIVTLMFANGAALWSGKIAVIASGLLLLAILLVSAWLSDGRIRVAVIESGNAVLYVGFCGGPSAADADLWGFCGDAHSPKSAVRPDFGECQR